MLEIILYHNICKKLWIFYKKLSNFSTLKLFLALSIDDLKQFNNLINEYIKIRVIDMSLPNFPPNIYLICNGNRQKFKNLYLRMVSILGIDSC